MLSKVFNSSLCGLFKTQPTIISTGYTFCTTSSSKHDHPLRNKILSLTSFDEFIAFFKEKSKEFDPICYSVASRTLAKILTDTRPFISYQHRESIRSFLTQLQKIDIDSLTLHEYSQLLYLLKVIKLDTHNSNNFVTQYIKLILERSDNKIKELEIDTNLNRLTYFYQEYCSLSSRQTSVIVKRINILLQSNNSEVESQHLSVNEIIHILRGMKCKPLISNEEHILFRTIIKTVTEELHDKLSFLELVQISIGINEIVSNNYDLANQAPVEEIHKKVLTNIGDMDEKSIMYILNAKKTNNRIYNQIYKTIFEKILDEIQPNGESSFNELFTLKLFNGISDKVKLVSAIPENQEKFLTFLRVTVIKNPKFIHSFVESFIEKGFFNSSQLLRVQEILESIPDFHLKLSLIYLLSKKNMNVEKLLSIDRLKEVELKEKNLVMMSSVIQKLSTKEGPNKAIYLENLARLKAKFFELYKVEDESFNKVMFSLSPGHIASLYHTFRKEFEAQLPNPFETEQSERYRFSWIKLHLHGCPELFFNKKFGNQLKDKLRDKDFDYIMRTIAIDGYDSTESLCNALTLISKRTDLIISNDQLLSSLAKMMTFEMNKIFSGRSSDFIKMKFWQVLNYCIDKLDGAKFLDNFLLVTSNILKSRIYDFKYSTQYQFFLMKLLRRSDSIKNKSIAIELLEECLKNNLIKRESIPDLGQKIKESALLNQNLLLKMIESNTFVLEGVEVKKQNLYMFLFNLSPETSKFISANHGKIVSLIEEMKPREVWKCISHFRLGGRANESAIMEVLFKQINKSSLQYDEFSPIFLGEILRRNNFDKYFVKIDNIKEFFKKSLNYFAEKRNINKIPLEDHIELIKTVNDFKVRNDDYIHAVFENYSSDVNIFKRELYLVAGHIGLDLNKKEIQKLIEQNFFANFTSSFSKCFNIFIYNEKQLENPGTYLQTIIERYNELKASEKVPIYSSFFEYLKKVYPEETKNFEPNHVENADFCRSLESINNKNLNLLREMIEEVTNEKWIEENVVGNYYYTFRNFAIIIPMQSKYHGENNIIKKILSKLTGIDKFIILNKRQASTRSAVKFLTQSFNGILTLEEEEKILKRIDEKFQQSKEYQKEGEHAEEIEPEQEPKSTNEAVNSTN